MADLIRILHKDTALNTASFPLYTSVNTDVVLLFELAKRMPWLSPQVNRIDLTNIGTKHSRQENLTSDGQQQVAEILAEIPVAL